MMMYSFKSAERFMIMMIMLIKKGYTFPVPDHQLTSTICYDPSGAQVRCPNLPCRFRFVTMEFQINLLGNSTYQLTNNPNDYCASGSQPWKGAELVEVHSPQPGAIMTYKVSVNSTFKVGPIPLKKEYVRLAGQCAIRPIGTNSIELSVLGIGYRAVKMTGAIQWQGVVKDSRKFVAPLSHTDSKVHIVCGETNAMVELESNTLEQCIEQKSPTYGYRLLAEWRCGNPVVFYAIVSLLFLIVINMGLKFTGLQFILYPFYGVLGAFTIIPVYMLIKRCMGCPYCKDIRLLCHKCPLRCCHCNFASVRDMSNHRAKSGCQDPSFYRMSRWLSSSVFPNFINFLLVSLVLSILVPMSNAQDQGSNQQKCFPSCSICLSLPNFYLLSNLTNTPLDCNTLHFFGYYRHDPRRVRRSLSDGIEPLTVEDPVKFDMLNDVISPRLDVTRYVKLHSTVPLVDGMFTGPLTLTLQATTGSVRGYRITTEDGDFNLKAYIRQAKCIHQTVYEYKTCSSKTVITDTKESCTGGTDSCVIELNSTEVQVNHVFPNVQAWGCEEPGCLSINTGCLGVKCMDVMTSDCCDVHTVENSRCEIDICVSYANKVICKTLQQGTTSDPFMINWSKEVSTPLNQGDKIVDCNPEIKVGKVNELNQHDDIFGTPQIKPNGDLLYKDNFMGNYQCYAIAYKDVRASRCSKNTYHQKQFLRGTTLNKDLDHVYYDLDVNLGTATLQLEVRDVKLVSVDLASVSITTDMSCHGEVGSITGLVCKISIKSEQSGTMDMGCTTLEFQERKIHIQEGLKEYLIHSFINSEGKSQDSCELTDFNGNTQKFTATILAKPMTHHVYHHNKYLMNAFAHGQSYCDSMICNAVSFLRSLPDTVFTVYNFIGIMVIVVISAFLLYLVVYGSIYFYYAFTKTYKDTKQHFSKSS